MVLYKYWDINMNRRLALVFLATALVSSVALAAPAITVKHYTIDSSTSDIFNPLAIPRFQIAPLSAPGHVALYTMGFPDGEAFRVTFNLDSSVRWVSTHMGALSDLDHSHISVHNDTIYQGRSNDSRMYAFAMRGDSLTQLFTHSWGLSESELYIASVLRLPGSDTAIAITRGHDDNNAVLYWISTNKGQTWGPSSFLVNREGTGRCRIGGLYYNNTVAAFIDSADNSIGWYTWDRANRRWINDGRVFNRSMYRGFAGNVLQDTIRFLIGTIDKNTGDSVIWAYRSKNASQWTEGPAFQTSTIDQSLPPYTALTYIEASRRLVLFYSKNDQNNDDAWTIYMRYFDTNTWNWSAPTRVSRGNYVWKVTTAQIVPASHGDVCYAMYPMDSGSYHYADLVKITFQEGGDVTPPGRINDLGAAPGPGLGQMRLSWTAPGDDGSSGTVSRWEVKYATVPISETNWLSAITYPNPPSPVPAGQTASCVISGLTPGETYFSAIKSYDEASNVSPLSNVAYIDIALDVSDDEEILPRSHQLLGNHPNPFNSATRIDYFLASNSDVTLSIYDILGHEINELVDGRQQMGSHTVIWDGRDARGLEVATGVYLCRLRADNWLDSKKLLLLR